MLCCVSRKAAEGSVLKKPPLLSRSSSSSSTSTVTSSKLPASQLIINDLKSHDEVLELLPCSICGRTFKPQSLEKHTKICERAAIKKRKPFDSFKQRLQGTELEEYLPKVVTKRDVRPEDKFRNRNTWKQTHDEFLKTIRAARGETVATSSQYRQVTTVAPGAPTRANEKGLCPTCNRQFGIKAYDRHVAWCKERIMRAPASQATNVAKERLDARMKYRAPLLKSRRMTNKEKYAPRKNNITQNINNNNIISNNNRINNSINFEKKDANGLKTTDPVNIKQPAVTERRSGHGKSDGVIAPGPVKSRPSDRSTKGICQDYDPYLLAEQQLTDLLSDTCSDKSYTDSPNRYGIKPTSSQSTSSSSPLYPLTHSSAFVKYPNSLNLDNASSPEKQRGSVVAPPSEFDDLSIGFSSSDSTEVNSILFAELESACRREEEANKNKTSTSHVLGRRMIIDKARALGTTDHYLDSNLNRRVVTSTDKSRKIVEKTTVKPIRPMVTRSNSVRSASAPKIPERKETAKVNSRSSPGTRFNNQRNNFSNLSGSNLSLSSIVSSEIDVKRSNSMFDDLVSSFDDDSGSYPSLRSFLKNDPLSMSSPVQPSRTRNGQISDEDLSSPDSFKKQECSKLSADSAYSSLNRKYSNGRNDTTGRLEEESSLLRRRENEIISNLKSKMSKFCHECGTKFPETAKFCCECGIQRLAL
ncbi:uncharacterized protein LOC141528125 isoform X3 [Cotesia typhae]|uniref:uncharacterized protein LOC141528125 isoform X3 n=1 Tax=Cotesia typhae TaxID=2053667 RepID=UPI003D682A4F